LASRGARSLLLLAALAAWWFGFRELAPFAQRVTGFERIADRDVATIVGHWFAWQLPGVIPCVLVWIVGERLGLMPSFVASLGGGGSWRTVVRSGLLATVVLLALTVGIGGAVGTFGFHPYVPKMLGDLVSNMYEEIVHRGLLFAAFYGVAAGATFPLSGALDRRGLVAGTVGSCVVFAAGHGQYPLALRVVLGVIAVVFVWPWVRARSLWAPWIPHTLGDVIGDSILKV
jgi:hypothetical protein